MVGPVIEQVVRAVRQQERDGRERPQDRVERAGARGQ
jgi:hypothetical protein